LAIYKFILFSPFPIFYSPIVLIPETLELIRIRDHSIIQCFYNLGFTAAACFRLCQAAYPLDGPSRSLVYLLYSQLANGPFSLVPSHGGGVLPSWEFLLNLEDKVIELPFASVRFLAATLSVARETVKVALVQYLHYRKFHFRWIPHILTPENKQERVSYATVMLEILNRDQPFGFHHVITGDETWVPF
jgi:hypothetical protein